MKRGKLANLEEVITNLKSFLPQYLTEHGIDTSKNFKCLNPKHQDENPSMSCSQNPENAFCFSCGCTCDIFQAAYWLEDKPISGPGFIEENVTYLAEKFGVTLEVAEMTEDELYRYRTYRAYKDAADLIANRNFGNYTLLDAEIARRGWDPKTVKVGTVVYKDFRETLKAMGYEASFQNEIDLGRPDIFDEHNMIFTICDEFGRPVGFAARNLTYDANGDQPKYMNQKTTGLRCNIYQKGRRLYELHTALKYTPPLYIFEGYTDVLTAQHKGLFSACAIGGTAFTPQHVETLKELNQYNIIICLDGDKAGKAKTAALLDDYLAGQRDMQIEVINLPDDMDPDDFLRQKGLDEFLALKKWSAFEWRLNLFRDDDNPEDICAAMIPLIVNEKSHIRQDKMCGDLALFTGLDKKIVSAELERLQNEKERRKVREKEVIVDQMVNEIRRSPADAKSLLYECAVKIEAIEEKYDENNMSIASVLQFVESQKQFQDELSGDFAGFHLSELGLGGLGEKLNGNWRQDVFMCFGGSANSGKCLTGDARIVDVLTGQLKTIREIVENKEHTFCHTILGNNLISAMHVTDHFDEGEKETIRIETILGHEITGTLVHPVLTKRGWVQLQHLKLDDKVAVPRNFHCGNNSEANIADEEIRLLAYLVAEGCLTRGVGIASDTQEIVNDFYYCVEKLFGSLVRIRIDNEANPKRCNSFFVVKNLEYSSAKRQALGTLIKYARERRGFTRQDIASQLETTPEYIRNIEKGSANPGLALTNQLYDLLKPELSLTRLDIWCIANENPAFTMLEEYDIKDKLAKNKCLPGQVFSWSCRQQREFISALWDCDGSYSNGKTKPSIELSSASNKLAKDLQHLLLRQGILARLRYKPVWLNEKQFDSWMVEITSKKFTQPFIEMTTSIAKERAREEIFLRGQTDRDARGYYGVEIINDCYYVPLKSVQNAGLQRVYDISIALTHNFIANDIVVHNTSLCCQLAFEIASNPQNNACVIYHTIDDSKEQILPRFICQAYGRHDLTMNQVRNPNYYKRNDPAGEVIAQRREMGYKELLKLVKDGRIIMKDVTDGASFAYGESLIKYYKRVFPDRQIIYILDNLHKSPDFHGMEPRMRFKTLSNYMKNTATRNHVPIISTVEYTKLPPATIPTNNNIAETVGITYDANFIGHLYNDVHERGEGAVCVHQFEDQTLPRIRLAVGKNKITEFKDRLFLDFFPAAGLFRKISLEKAEQDMRNRMKEIRNANAYEAPPRTQFTGTDGDDATMPLE